jgi:hypothetical protein
VAAHSVELRGIKLDGVGQYTLLEILQDRNCRIACPGGGEAGRREAIEYDLAILSIVDVAGCPNVAAEKSCNEVVAAALGATPSRIKLLRRMRMMILGSRALRVRLGGLIAILLLLLLLLLRDGRLAIVCMAVLIWISTLSWRWQLL